MAQHRNSVVEGPYYSPQTNCEKLPHNVGSQCGNWPEHLPSGDESINVGLVDGIYGVGFYPGTIQKL